MLIPTLRSNSTLPLCLIAIVLALLVPTVLKAESPVALAEFLQTIAVPGPALGDAIPSPNQAATCGGFTCSPSQSCYYCGNGLSCQTTGSTCCAGGATFCSPNQICVYCNVSSSCQPPGTVCCGGSPCQPPWTCHNNAYCY